MLLERQMCLQTLAPHNAGIQRKWDFFCTASFPKCPQQWGLSQAEASSLHSILISHRDGRDPSPWAFYLLPPRNCVTRKWDLNPVPLIGDTHLTPVPTSACGMRTFLSGRRRDYCRMIQDRHCWWLWAWRKGLWANEIGQLWQTYVLRVSTRHPALLTPQVQADEICACQTQDPQRTGCDLSQLQQKTNT